MRTNRKFAHALLALFTLALLSSFALATTKAIPGTTTDQAVITTNGAAINEATCLAAGFVTTNFDGLPAALPDANLATSNLLFKNLPDAALAINFTVASPPETFMALKESLAANISKVVLPDKAVAVHIANFTGGNFLPDANTVAIYTGQMSAQLIA